MPQGIFPMLLGEATDQRIRRRAQGTCRLSTAFPESRDTADLLDGAGMATDAALICLDW
jgi:hypothetical protein